ncbi:MAG TPA: hypothetical protein VMF30_02815, partial [Pirellulales bacterium]|nr:hypothetical protein [Pirellulales bacterium]
KLKIDVDTIKRFGIQHGEKLVFGLAVFVLLLFIWNTIQLEVLGPDKQPDRLADLSQKTDTHIKTSNWDPVRQNIEVIDYPMRAKHVALDEKDYHLQVYLDKPLWEQHDKRPIPKVLPVEELVATPGQGFLAVKPDGETASVGESVALKNAGETKPRGVKLGKEFVPKGFYYIAVTGVVPVRKQIGIYEEAFRNGMGYNAGKDVPVYRFGKIERAETIAGKTVWKEIDLGSVIKFVRDCAPEKPADVVDPDYVDRFTMPLGPLLGEEWSPAVAGHPKIPPAGRFDQTKKQPEKTEAPPAVAESAENFSFDSPNPKAAAPAKAAPAAAQAARGPAPAPVHEEKLFRFIDYTVEPGKRYRYRVKLVLENPNLEVQDRYLKEPAASHTPTLETAWSQPTKSTLVPRGINIFAGPAVLKPSNSQRDRDPEVEVCVVSFDQKRGAEPVLKKNVQRGTLLNFPLKELLVLKPDRSGLVKWDKYDFRSNALVVDVQGGRKLSLREKTLVEPVEILVLDADGRASVHDELDDADAFHARVAPLEEGEAPTTKKKDKDEPLKDFSNPYEKGTKPRAGEGRPTRPRRPD